MLLRGPIIGRPCVIHGQTTILNQHKHNYGLFGRYKFSHSLLRDAGQPARLRHLAQYLDSEIRLVWIVRAEFLRGAVMAGHDAVRVNEFLGRHQTIWPNEETLLLYAQVYATLSRTNQLIGPHDLWIAATALQSQLPLLTKNVNEFSRVQNLQVVDYTASA